MRVIGLTGGIGTGKSTASDYLKKKGCRILDADQISRDLTKKGGAALCEIVKVFGSDILLPDGEMDRAKMADLVFHDASRKTLLEKIIHTKVIDQVFAEIKEFPGPFLFIDAPLLLEIGFDEYTDEVWLVDAEDDVRISRVMNRDHISRDSVESRIANQMSQKEKRKRADHVLDNSGDREQLYRQLDALYQDLSNNWTETSTDDAATPAGR